MLPSATVGVGDGVAILPKLNPGFVYRKRATLQNLGRGKGNKSGRSQHMTAARLSPAMPRSLFSKRAKQAQALARAESVAVQNRLQSLIEWTRFRSAQLLSDRWGLPSRCRPSTSTTAMSASPCLFVRLRLVHLAASGRPVVATLKCGTLIEACLSGHARSRPS